MDVLSCACMYASACGGGGGVEGRGWVGCEFIDDGVAMIFAQPCVSCVLGQGLITCPLQF